MIGYTVFVQPNGDQSPQELTLHLQPEEGVLVSTPLSMKKPKKNKLKKAHQVEIALSTQSMINLANREDKVRPLTNSMEKATAEDRKLKTRKPENKTGPEIGKHRDTAKSKETSSGLQEKRSRTRYACPFHRQQHKKCPLTCTNRLKAAAAQNITVGSESFEKSEGSSFQLDSLSSVVNETANVPQDDDATSTDSLSSSLSHDLTASAIPSFQFQFQDQLAHPEPENCHVTWEDFLNVEAFQMLADDQTNNAEMPQLESTSVETPTENEAVPFTPLWEESKPNSPPPQPRSLMSSGMWMNTPSSPSNEGHVSSCPTSPNGKSKPKIVWAVPTVQESTVDKAAEVPKWSMGSPTALSLSQTLSSPIDYTKLILTKKTLDVWLQDSVLQKCIAGFFVRVCVGEENSVPIYYIGCVVDTHDMTYVSRYKHNQDSIEGTKTLTIGFGNRLQKMVSLSLISNQYPTKEEWESLFGVLVGGEYTLSWDAYQQKLEALKHYQQQVNHSWKF